LPRCLLRPYLGGTLRRALLVRAMFAAALAAVSTGLVGYAWQQWIREATESRLLAMQNTAHAEYKVTIRHRKETAALAQALSATLAADGFDTTIIEAALEPPRENAQSPPLVNRIQWGDSADEPAATSIAQRLAYLTWGQAPEVTELTQSPGLKELRVLLRTPGTTGSEFTDPLVNPLTPEQITELVIPPELLPEAQQPQEPQEPDARETGQVPESLSRTFRDPLQIGGDGPEMVSLLGGTFLMGSPNDEPERDSDEGLQHRVTVRPFAIGRTEVRFVDYDRFAEATGREKPDDAGLGRGDRPVINVSWQDAREYAEWLSKQTGHSYRLPSEAEWEYAARAGTRTPFWTGKCIHTDQANYDGNYDYNDCGARTGVWRRRTVPVGSLPANPFGLHEVAGNVYEWVEDCWHDSYAGAPTDGSAWRESGGGDCAGRVVRGGGWINNQGRLRSAYCGWIAADVAYYDVGIRLARTF